MNQDTEQSNQDTSAPKDVPSYLIYMNAKLSNRKVGQTFITSIKMPQKEVKPLTQEETKKELIIQDIMKSRGVSREEALNILNQVM